MEQIKLRVIKSFYDALLNKKPSTNQQINSLDGLRGVAVILVILSHLSLAGLNLFPAYSFAGVGKVGVWLFFTLSSFLLTLQFLDRGDGALLNMRLWANYLIRRFFRIYPLFIVVMFVSWLFSGSGYFVMDDLKDLTSRLLLQNAKGVEWSILVEFRYYLILPIIVLSFTVLLRRQTLYVAIVTLLALLIADLTRPPIDLISLRPYISIFILGSLSAFLHWKFRWKLSLLSVYTRWVFEILASIIAIVLFSLSPSVYGWLINNPVPLNYWHSNLTLFASLWSIFILSYMNGKGYIESFLSRDWLRVIGIVSFGLYLWHPPIILIVKHNLPVHESIQAVAVMGVTLLVSGITYLLVERPFLKIKLNALG